MHVLRVVIVRAGRALVVRGPDGTLDAPSLLVEGLDVPSTDAWAVAGVEVVHALRVLIDGEAVAVVLHSTGTPAETCEWVALTAAPTIVPAGLEAARAEMRSTIGTVRRSLGGTTAAPWVGASRWEVAVGEVMSQQTQLARAIERWRRWFERWPTAADCAAAPLADVLAEWQGLGYPRRARALREIATTVSEHGWPEDYRSLPGIGPYTDAAIRAFADDEPIVPRDANVERVIARRLPLFDDATPPIDARTGRVLMEFGQSTCRARPRCGSCPVADGCAVPLGHDPAPRPRQQAAYRGSLRERRGAVLRAVTGGAPLPADPEAIASLVADGLLEP